MKLERLIDLRYKNSVLLQIEMYFRLRKQTGNSDPNNSIYCIYSDLYKELNAMDSMYSFYIKEVVDQLNDLLLKLNHEKGMDEGRQRLLEMATSIEQFPQDIVSSQRIATEKTTIQVEQDGNIGDFRISKGKTKLNLYLLTDLIIISKLKQRGLVNKTNKEIYMTTIMHDSIRGLYRVSSCYIKYCWSNRRC